MDAIENASENTAVGDMMAVVEKAGLTKDSVLGKVSSMYGIMISLVDFLRNATIFSIFLTSFPPI